MVEGDQRTFGVAKGLRAVLKMDWYAGSLAILPQLSPSAILSGARRMVKALEFMHAKSLVHMDVKLVSQVGRPASGRVGGCHALSRSKGLTAQRRAQHYRGWPTAQGDGDRAQLVRELARGENHDGGLPAPRDDQSPQAFFGCTVAAYPPGNAWRAAAWRASPCCSPVDSRCLAGSPASPCSFAYPWLKLRLRPCACHTGSQRQELCAGRCCCGSTPLSSGTWHISHISHIKYISQSAHGLTVTS